MQRFFTHLCILGLVLLGLWLPQLTVQSERAMPNAAPTKAATRAATAAASTSKIVYTMGMDPQRREMTELFIMNADGSNRVRLTNNKALDENPAVSPNGKQVVFASKRDGNFEIYVMNIDGSKPTRLTKNTVNDLEPKWSPDGKRVAFVSMRDGNAEIYVMNANGTKPVRLTKNTAIDRMPAWSPDGKQIVFVSDRESKAEIYVMSAAGAKQTRLTKSSAQNLYPSWSPDGKRILFSSDRDDDPQKRLFRDVPNSSIYTMNPDGSNITRLTPDGMYAAPCWSPDGKRIAFMGASDKAWIGNIYTGDLFVMNADGSDKMVNLTNTGGEDESECAWLP